MIELGHKEEQLWTEENKEVPVGMEEGIGKKQFVRKWHKKNHLG